MKRSILAALALSLYATSANAVVIFSDNFDDGDVSNWTASSDFGGFSGIEASSLDAVSPGFSLRTLLIPIGRHWTASPTYSRGSIEFTNPVAGDYVLRLFARTQKCSGCVKSYEVLLDGHPLTFPTLALSFEPRSFALSSLAAGTHSLTLGLLTTAAISGKAFQAFFDDVCISTRGECFLPTAAAAREPSRLLVPGPPSVFLVPEPSSLMLMSLGLVGFGIARGCGTSLGRADGRVHLSAG